MGTHVRCKLSVADQDFEVLAGVDLLGRAQEGEQVTVSLPPEALWSMPAEAT